MTQQKSHLRLVQTGNKRLRADVPETRTKPTKLGEMLPLRKSDAPPPPELCWTCAVCGVVEPLCLPTGRWIKRSCACQRRQREQRAQEEQQAVWRREQCRRTFGGWLGQRWVDEEIVQAMTRLTFESFDALRQPDGFEQAFTFAKHPHGNLLLYGDYGSGKTHLEAAICNELREVGRLLPDGTRKPMASLFVSAPQFFFAYEETRRAADQTQHLRLMQQAVSTPLLVIDDIDKSRPTEQRWEIYWLIIDERSKAKCPTVLSTNKREELECYVGAASLSRLSRGLVAVPMVGDDYRREQ